MFAYNAVARLGLTNALAPSALIKYAQGAAFVWSLESTSGSQAVYDNYKEKVRLVIAENGTVLDVFPRATAFFTADRETLYLIIIEPSEVVVLSVGIRFPNRPYHAA